MKTEINIIDCCWLDSELNQCKIKSEKFYCDLHEAQMSDDLIAHSQHMRMNKLKVVNAK